MLLLDFFTAISNAWETRGSMGSDEHPTCFHGVRMPDIVNPLKEKKEPREPSGKHRTS